jgi:formate-dependent nitrite reductase membrane component NrfD
MNTEKKQDNTMINVFIKIKPLLPIIGLTISFLTAFLKVGVPQGNLFDVITDPFHPFMITAGSTFFGLIILYVFLLKLLIIKFEK